MINKGRLKIKRKKRIRGKISGTSDRPRLSVYRSLKHIYAQLIDDEEGRTLVSAASAGKGKDTSSPSSPSSPSSRMESAKQVGRAIAESAITAGIDMVVFDRGGNLYHGRVKALADAAREGGLKF